MRTRLLLALFFLFFPNLQHHHAPIAYGDPLPIVKPHYREVPPSTTTTTLAKPVSIPTTSTVPAASTPVHAAYSDSSGLYQAWLKVATCEEGGTQQFKLYGPWFYSGYNYPDSIGIDRTNWFAYGGGSDVSSTAQIAVGQKLIIANHASIPDQNGCQRGGW